MRYGASIRGISDVLPSIGVHQTNVERYHLLFDVAIVVPIPVGRILAVFVKEIKAEAFDRYIFAGDAAATRRDTFIRS